MWFSTAGTGCAGQKGKQWLCSLFVYRSWCYAQCIHLIAAPGGTDMRKKLEEGGDVMHGVST